MRGKRAALLLLIGSVLVFQLLADATMFYVAVKVGRFSNALSETPSSGDDDDASPVVQRVLHMTGKRLPPIR